MIKARLSGDLVIFGLSEENVKRLKLGMPIKIRGSEVGLPGTIVIMYGETEALITAEILSVTNPPDPVN